MSGDSSASRRAQAHIATGTSVKEVRDYLRTSRGLEEGEDILFLAQVLSFMILGTEAEKLSAARKTQSNRFVWRKLRSALDLLDRVFPS